MKKQFGIFCCISLLASFASCKKDKQELLENYPGFEGSWLPKEVYLTGNYSKSFSFYKSKKGLKTLDFGSYSPGPGEFDVEGEITIKGSILTIKDDYSFTKKKHTYTIHGFPEKVNTPPSEDWWKMNIDGVDYYSEKNSNSISICDPDLHIMNTGNDTIFATANGQAIKIKPGGEIYVPTCFDCEVSYSDDHGNSFSYTILSCDSKVEVH